jgi:hypothetical protein
MKKLILTAVATAVWARTGVSAQSVANSSNALRPADAQPSQCYAKVLLPAKFETRSEQAVKVPASRRVEIVPATYKNITEQVLLTPERKEIKTVPAVYGNVDESVTVRPVTTRVETVPASYKTVSDQ